MWQWHSNHPDRSDNVRSTIRLKKKKKKERQKEKEKETKKTMKGLRKKKKLFEIEIASLIEIIIMIIPGNKITTGNGNKLQNAPQLCLGYSPLASAIIVSPNIMYMRDFVL